MHAILANEIFMPQRGESYCSPFYKLCRIKKPVLKVMPIPVTQLMLVWLAFAWRKLGRFKPNEPQTLFVFSLIKIGLSKSRRIKWYKPSQENRFFGATLK